MLLDYLNVGIYLQQTKLCNITVGMEHSTADLNKEIRKGLLDFSLIRSVPPATEKRTFDNIKILMTSFMVIEVSFQHHELAKM
jgi:hypothetical protein